MEIYIKPTRVNEELNSPNKPIQYFSELGEINFQTPFQGAEFRLSLDPIKSQSESPADSLFCFTTFVFEDNYIGSSTYQKNLNGNKLTIKVGNEVYNGELEEGFTKLIK